MSELHIHMHFNEGPLTRELPAVDPEMPAHAKPKTYTVGQIHDAVMSVIPTYISSHTISHGITNLILNFLEELK
jgi:hypothetical protein